MSSSRPLTDIDPGTEGPGPSTTPRTRARARHILDHYFIGPSRSEAVLEIWAYTPRMSYYPGDQVALHVSTTAARWDLEVGRDGLEYEPPRAIRVLHSPPVQA